MDEKIDIKEEPVWHEGSISAPLDSGELVSEMTHLKEETKSELLEPGRTDVNPLEPFADVNDEIFKEEHTVGDLVPCLREEDNLENVAGLKILNTGGELLCHLPTDTVELPHQCSECSKTFPFKSHLKRHKIVHSGEKTFSCNECGKIFGLKSNLQKHLLMHFEKEGESSHCCVMCGKTFTYKSSLVRHMRIHNKELPYHCGECGNRFSTEAYFQTHMLIHSDKSEL